jgi:SAM-dependent methyltransferase
MIDGRPASFGTRILLRTFGRPEGVLGRLGGILMAHTNRKAAAWAIDLLDVRPDDHVLEVGFGPGVGVELVAKAATEGRVAGVDSSDEMVVQATTRNAKAIESGQVELRCGSAERPPFEDGIFDKALAVNSMQVWPDPIAGAARDAACFEDRWHGDARVHPPFGTIEERAHRCSQLPVSHEPASWSLTRISVLSRLSLDRADG